MKVYISSTYRDLQRHRSAVATVLRRMGHQAVGMEDYVAEGVKPLHRCLADVESCDAYLGIFAWRYGFVPGQAQLAAAQASPSPAVVPSEIAPAALPPGTVFGRTSITECELRKAVQSQKHILVFLLDPDADWPSSQFDAVAGNTDSSSAIARLRQEISQQYLVGYFRTPEELASQVSAAVYRTEMSRQMSLESLQVEARFNQPFIRNGPVADSTLAEIKNVIAGPQEIQALQINLGRGLDWWATRLYFLSSLAADLTNIEVLLFLGDQDAFIGVTNPKIVKEKLYPAHPIIAQYELALTQASAGSPAADLLSEIDRRANLWTTVANKTPGGEAGTPIFVNDRELKHWLSPYLITQALESEPGDNASFQMQRLIDWPMRFVPLVEKGQFARVVDKQALAEQIAKIFVREQVSRALSMTR